MQESKTSAEVQARKRAEEKVDFLGHLVVYVLVNLFLFLLNLLTSPNVWWFQWSLFGWGIGLILHGVSVYILDGMFEGVRDRIYKNELSKIESKK